MQFRGCQHTVVLGAVQRAYFNLFDLCLPLFLTRVAPQLGASSLVVPWRGHRLPLDWEVALRQHFPAVDFQLLEAFDRVCPRLEEAPPPPVLEGLPVTDNQEKFTPWPR